MEKKIKYTYEAPETSVLSVNIKSSLLQGSTTTNSMNLGNYNEELI